MIIYCGKRTHNGVEVTVNGRTLPLRPSLNIRFHSPTGFEWGYGGSGPAQLALAILLHAFSRATAEKWYQEFKFDVIARLDRDGWELSFDSIREWLERMEVLCSSSADATESASG